jgi:hypothetical protein
VQHLRNETFPALRKLRGFVSASIHSRPLNDGLEFIVITLWNTLEDIVLFAGAEIEVAVVPPKAAAMMLDYDGRCRHFEVIDGAV